MNRAVHVPLLVFAGALLGAGCDVRVREGGGVSVGLVRGTARDEWSRTYSLTPGGHLEVVNILGPVDVLASEGPDSAVVIRREVTAASEDAARQVLEEMTIHEEVGADRVLVESRRDRGPRGGGPPLLGRRPDVTVEYTVHVPAAVRVIVRTSSGAVRLTEIEAPVEAAVVSGSITGEDLRGPLEAQAVNGSIRIGMAAVTGAISITTVNGPIALTLPPDAQVSLEARAVNGRVSVAEELALADRRQDERHLSATLNGGGASVRLQTTNGRIRIAAP